LLANADKKLYSQISSDALKHNNFTLLQEDNQSVKKELVGFKINKYVPLSHRALKQIDKLKHLAEKKRLLYVALTRAEHDIVISAQLKEKKDGDITLGEDSYLHMICESLNISKEQLFEQDQVYCIETDDIQEEIIVNKTIKYVDHTLNPIEFTSTKPLSATQSDEVTEDINTEAAQRGTIIHHIIEHYWKNFSIQKDKILDKTGVFSESDRVAIIKSMEHFYKSEAYKHLQSGTEYRFELEFNVDNTHGFIDLIYFDVKHNGWVIVDFKTGIPTSAKEKKYQEQLMFYKNAIETLGYQVKDTQILWI
jgi:ATP-dependent exoDNAse (exonuclease V) beta subunit